MQESPGSVGIESVRLADMYPNGIDAATRDRLVQYMEARIQRNEAGCWVWKGRMGSKGYGAVSHRSVNFRAHRIAFELLKAEIPPNLVLDHLCRNRACCNPDHLECVTNRENLMRGEGAAAKGARQTHCAQGHSFEIYGARRANGYRWCRECQRIRDRKRNQQISSRRSLVTRGVFT